MFTGIIEQVGSVESLQSDGQGGRLRVHLSGADASSSIADDIKLGDSISVSGCCLTVVEFDKEHFSADLSSETLRRTSLAEKKPGDPINLERPLAAGARLGGHFVQGHVDGVGHITALTPQGDNWWLSVRVPDELQRYVAEKGSISIEGISLTVARWGNGVATIAVIPFTYVNTNIHALAAGNRVNLEVDILAKYVESLIGSAKTGMPARLTEAALREQGF